MQDKYPWVWWNVTRAGWFLSGNIPTWNALTHTDLQVHPFTLQLESHCFMGTLRRGLRGFTAPGHRAGGTGLVGCRVCPAHLGSAGRHSRRRGGTARCPAGSGPGGAASRSSSAHLQRSCSYIHTYVCPAQGEKEKGQDEHLADMKLVFQATFWTVGEISLDTSRNEQTEKLLLTTKPNIYTCT